MQEEGKKIHKEKKKRRSERTSADGEVKMKKSAAESHTEDVSDKMAVLQEVSDVEEGGLDLDRSFKPISAYLQEREEMLEQSFHVLGEKKLTNMLPHELKDCALTEIKRLCWDQLQQLSDIHLLEILEGKELTVMAADEEKRVSTDGQQDSIVDSTSCLKETDEKQGSASEEDSDVLSINADDSDIEGHKDAKPEEAPPPSASDQSCEPEAELQQDIDRSVSEILALTQKQEVTPAPEQHTEHPSNQQLELLELEMRARAIKALMKAGEAKKSL